jgi:hypothetical protein
MGSQISFVLRRVHARSADDTVEDEMRNDTAGEAGGEHHGGVAGQVAVLLQGGRENLLRGQESAHEHT